VVVAGLLSLHTGAAIACRCTEPGPKLAYKSADGAVLGKIASVQKLDGGADEIAYVVEVSEWWKHPVDSSITVHSSTTCRFEAKVGARYVLFLKQSQQGKLETANCMGNRRAEKAGSLLRFLRSTKPRSTRASVTPKPIPACRPSPVRE
jgi:hypothetical protein